MALEPAHHEEDTDDGVARCRCGTPWAEVFGYFVYCPHCDRPHESTSRRMPCPLCVDYGKAFRAEEEFGP